MDKLTYELRGLCLRNKDGSHAIQAERRQTLKLISQQLKNGGYKQMQAGSLKSKHVTFLVDAWQEQNLSVGTIKNRLCHLRWWAEKVGKPSVMPKDNHLLGGRQSPVCE